MIHFLQFFFAQPHQPWYQAAVWGNVVAVVPCGILGFLWGDRCFKRLHKKLNVNRQIAEEIHHFVHHGVPHPDLEERQRARSL